VFFFDWQIIYEEIITTNLLVELLIIILCDMQTKLNMASVI